MLQPGSDQASRCSQHPETVWNVGGRRCNHVNPTAACQEECQWLSYVQQAPPRSTTVPWSHGDDGLTSSRSFTVMDPSDAFKVRVFTVVCPVAIPRTLTTAPFNIRAPVATVRDDASMAATTTTATLHNVLLEAKFNLDSPSPLLPFSSKRAHFGHGEGLDEFFVHCHAVCCTRIVRRALLNSSFTPRVHGRTQSNEYSAHTFRPHQNEF